jgi:hypothetical protein
MKLEIAVKAGEEPPVRIGLRREIANFIAAENRDRSARRSLRVPIEMLGSTAEVRLMPRVAAEMTVNVVPLPA